MTTALKKAVSIAAAFALTLTIMPMGGFIAAPSADAQEEALEAQATNANTDTVTIAGVDYYSYSHGMLDLINDYRQTWNPDLPKLKLDLELTRAAFQRAAEYNLWYDASGQRPDGTPFTTTIKGYSPDTEDGFSEIRMKDFTTAKGAFDEWLKDHNGAENVILNPDFESIGIGYFVQGVAQGKYTYYWDAIFSTSTSANTSVPSEDDRNAKKTIKFDYNICAKNIGLNLFNPSEMVPVLSAGESFQHVLNIEGETSYSNVSTAGLYANIDPSSVTWTSSNPSAVSVDSKGKITAKGPGTATITATLPSGKRITHQWQVKYVMERVTIAPIPDQTYTGSPITPKLNITAGGNTLQEGKDYKVTYSYNTNIGTARALVEGLGNGTGSRTVEFRINRAPITNVILTPSKFQYDGSPKTPTVAVYSGNKKLSELTDYTAFLPTDTSSIGSHEIVVSGRGNYQGEFKVSFEISRDGSGSNSGGNNGGNSGNQGGSGSITMHRLYNPYSGEHLFTSDNNERTTLVSLGWKYEGEAWKAPASGTSVYRLYNKYTGEHHYTTDKNEYDTNVKLGWNGEGVSFYSAGNSGTPVYRLFNPYASAFTHHYTTDINEYKTLQTYGWNDEKVGWYGVK